ncbi:hypothetical protein H845_104 [Komagataeibacter xylinus E25]|nr:hypothetical protein H845_104 [Komagataeibacter xylinus E25]
MVRQGVWSRLESAPVGWFFTIGSGNMIDFRIAAGQ